MSTFSATDVALEGFRVTRENPRATLIWAGVSLLVSILSGLITVAMGREAQVAYDVISGREAPTLEALMQALETLLPLLILGFGIQCVMAAAVYRIVLRHADHGFGYLKLGADEVRLAALTLIYFVMAILLLSVVALASGLVVRGALALGEPAAVLVGLAVYLFAMGLLVFVAVRLSLAPAITFAEKRLSVFGSWRLTEGYFWKLFGAYVIAIACMAVVALLALALFFVGAAIFTGGNLDAVRGMITPDESSIGAYFKPLTLAYLVFAAGLTAIYYAVIAAPAAVAYQALSNRPAQPAPDFEI